MTTHKYLRCLDKTCLHCQGDGGFAQQIRCSNCNGTGGHQRCPGCRAEGLDCMYEALAVCAVCGAMEGSLLPFCPERLLTFAEDQVNYQHYCNGTGPFAKATTKTMDEAREACWRYDFDRGFRTGADSLFKAVHELAMHIWNEETCRSNNR